MTGESNSNAMFINSKILVKYFPKYKNNLRNVIYMNPMKEMKKLKDIYDTIADSWSNLRTHPEKEVIEFSENVEVGFILDMGCGNCRNLLPFLEKDFVCSGMDFSKSMIKEAKKYLRKKGMKVNLLIGNVIHPPFRTNAFKHVQFVRTLSHIPSGELRLSALEEIKIICKEKILISVWKKKNDESDVWIDWNYHGKKYKRFYHLYSEEEFERDLRKTGFTIEKMWNDEKGNVWCIVK